MRDEVRGQKLGAGSQRAECRLCASFQLPDMRDPLVGFRATRASVCVSLRKSADTPVPDFGGSFPGFQRRTWA